MFNQLHKPKQDNYKNPHLHTTSENAEKQVRNQAERKDE